MIGDELALAPTIGALERLYIRLMGVPVNGLRIRLRRILPHCTGQPDKILDAGCGRGVFTFELAKKFSTATVVGVDMDQTQLATNRAIAQKAGLANIDFRCQDVANLPYREEFDLVLSVDNLEHIADDHRALHGLARALRPGGRLVLHVPGAERRWFLFRFRENFSVPGHFRPGYSRERIAGMVTAAGLQIEKIFYTYGWLETVSNNISYAITRAEAKNRPLYALLFPLLNAMAWLGRNSRPDKGAGILVVATKVRAKS